MKIKPRLMVPALALTGLLLVGTVGVVGAQTSDATPTPTPTQASPRDQALDRAAGILGVEKDALKDALKQAKLETARPRQDQAVKARLDRMVEKGRITQAEADSVYSWWQSRPDVAVGLLPGLKGHNGHGPMEPEHRGHRHGQMEQEHRGHRHGQMQHETDDAPATQTPTSLQAF